MTIAHKNDFFTGSLKINGITGGFFKIFLQRHKYKDAYRFEIVQECNFAVVYHNLFVISHLYHFFVFFFLLVCVCRRCRRVPARALALFRNLNKPHGPSWRPVASVIPISALNVNLLAASERGSSLGVEREREKVGKKKKTNIKREAW